METRETLADRNQRNMAEENYTEKESENLKIFTYCNWVKIKLSFFQPATHVFNFECSASPNQEQVDYAIGVGMWRLVHYSLHTYVKLNTKLHPRISVKFFKLRQTHAQKFKFRFQLQLDKKAWPFWLKKTDQKHERNRKMCVWYEEQSWRRIDLAWCPFSRLTHDGHRI